MRVFDNSSPVVKPFQGLVFLDIQPQGFFEIPKFRRNPGLWSVTPLALLFTAKQFQAKAQGITLGRNFNKQFYPERGTQNRILEIIKYSQIVFSTIPSYKNQYYSPLNGTTKSVIISVISG